MHSTLLIVALVAGHELPDGVVQCGLQLVVRNDQIELRYQLGMSPQTARDTLHSWGQPIGDDEQAYPALRQAALPRIPERLQVTVDGRPMTPRPLAVKEVRRHHARVECLYALPLPADDRPHELTIRDDNFPSAPGLREVAVKSRGDVELATDVPQVLGRATIETDPQRQLGPRQLTVLLHPSAPPGPRPALWLAGAIACLAALRGAAAAVSRG